MAFNKPDYASLAKIVKDYPFSERVIRYAHELCPDDRLIVGQSRVDRNMIGLVMPSSFELMGEARFDITDRFTDNFVTMFNRKSIELANQLIGAQLKKYWNICLSELSEYKPDSISGDILLEKGIDYVWKDDATVEYSVKDIKMCLEGDVLLLEDLMGLYREYLFAKEREPHLWAHYKMNLSTKIEDALCDFYAHMLEIKSENLEDVMYGLRVALITYRSDKGRFLTYANDIVKKVLTIIKKSKEHDAAHTSLSIRKAVEQWKQQHNLPKALADKVDQFVERVPDSAQEHSKEPRSYSLDLCRTLYQLEKEPIPLRYKAERADLKKALMGLQSGDQLFMITYYFEELNWKEMECVFELPADLLQQIHSALIKKIRRKLVDFDR